MELVWIILALLMIGFLVFIGTFILSILDDVSIFLFQKPLYIHLYLRPRKISPEQEFILRQKFQFYKQLNVKQKIYFHHRIASFTQKYQFIARKDLVNVMLTFGMRRYLIDAFDKIIIYPGQYLSTQSQQYYKGEFNPRMKAVVFSWQDFKEGFEIGNDNLNLGIHEFSHVLHFHSMQHQDASSLTFKKYYTQLSKEVNHTPNKQMLIESDYFRIYAYTNRYEFISVIIEHYFETPLEFQTKFPKLFQNVSRMLNHLPAGGRSKFLFLPENSI